MNTQILLVRLRQFSIDFALLRKFSSNIFAKAKPKKASDSPKPLKLNDNELMQSFFIRWKFYICKLQNPTLIHVNLKFAFLEAISSNVFILNLAVVLRFQAGCWSTIFFK